MALGCQDPISLCQECWSHYRASPNDKKLEGNSTLVAFPHSFPPCSGAAWQDPGGKILVFRVDGGARFGSCKGLSKPWNTGPERALKEH